MDGLPSGIVTFFLTDIQGSTALWEQFPQDMQQALVRHDAIMAELISAHRGAIIKHRGEGDSVFAVFADARSSILAACAVQLTLNNETWPLPQPIRIRIALHAGQAELRGGDYFGGTVNRTARLRAVAHGGQTLLSAAVAERVRDCLPDRTELRDLGRHRLRDLIEPERIYQLVHPDLPSEFPPLRSLDIHRHNLPQQTVSLIGREREIENIRGRLLDPSVRLVTLTGPGGIGKSRVALQVAAELIDEFDDGVFFVGLATISDPALVMQAIAEALGVRESSGQTLDDLIADYLRAKRILLLLDNFEQVVGAAPDIATLLERTTTAKILVTSRSVLHITGERVYPIPTLAVPEVGSNPPLDELATYDAVRLFVERAQAVKPDFRLTADNADAVLGICRHLDGLPLAIELAAARVRLFPPQAMVRRFANVLPLLTDGARDLPTRQQALRSAIAWSYDLLTAPHQRLFRQLSVFAGGCSFDGIEAVLDEVLPSLTYTAGDVEQLNLLEGVSALIDASLLQQREMSSGEPRFRMLQVLREFGQEQLNISGEADTVRERHAAYYLELAEIAEPELQGADQKSWFERLQIEHDNLRAALSWYQSAENFERFQRLAGALFWFWFGHGFWTEALEWHRYAIARSSARTCWRAKVLYGASMLCSLRGSHPTAWEWINESIEIARETGDDRTAARALQLLGMMTHAEGSPADARPILESALSIARSIDDGWTIGVVLRELGSLASQAGDVNQARQYLQESVRIHQERGDHWALAHAHNTLGDFMRSLAMYDRARTAYEESLETFDSLGMKDGRPSVLHNLAYVALNQGDVERAGKLFHEALVLFKDLGDQRGIGESLAGLAGVLGARNQLRTAAWLFGAAQAVLDATGTQISASNMTDYGRNLVSVSLALDENEYSAAFESGRSTSPDHTVARVLEEDFLSHFGNKT